MMAPFSWHRLKTSNSSSLPVCERGTYPGSSTISRFTLASWARRRSSLFLSCASIISWTRWEAVVKRTQRPFWQAASPRRTRHASSDAAWAEQDRVLATVDAVAAREIQHQHLVEARDCLEVDALELFDDGEAGLPDAALAIDHLHFHHPGQELHLIQVFGRALARRFLVFPQEGWQLQVMFGQDAGASTMASRVAQSAARGGGDEGLGQVRVARQVEMHGPSLDAGQQEMLHGIEADQATCHRVLHRCRLLRLREVLQQAQHLDVFALAPRAEARLDAAAPDPGRPASSTAATDSAAGRG